MKKSLKDSSVQDLVRKGNKIKYLKSYPKLTPKEFAILLIIVSFWRRYGATRYYKHADGSHGISRLIEYYFGMDVKHRSVRKYKKSLVGKGYLNYGKRPYINHFKKQCYNYTINWNAWRQLEKKFPEQCKLLEVDTQDFNKIKREPFT